MRSVASPPYKCIFCLSVENSFASAEHVIPESLGNDELILPSGWVCDQCNQYFGRKVESKALHSWEFGHWRCELALATKKGNLPEAHIAKGLSLVASVTDSPGWVFDVTHPYWRQKVAMISRGEGGVFRFPALGRVLLARFLGKIGLGIVAAELGVDVFEARYDEVRRFARFGGKGMTWDSAHACLPEDEVFRESQEPENVDITVYSYKFGFSGEGPNAHVVFVFQYGGDVYALYLTQPQSDERLLNCLQGIRLSPVR